MNAHTHHKAGFSTSDYRLYQAPLLVETGVRVKNDTQLSSLMRSLASFLKWAFAAVVYIVVPLGLAVVVMALTLLIVPWLMVSPMLIAGLLIMLSSYAFMFLGFQH